MTSPVIAYINQKALIHNLEVAKSHAPNAKVLAMVKANAYGHGLENITPILDSRVDAFAEARLDPALQLRRLGITKPIVIMAGFYTEQQLRIMTANNFEPVVHSELQVELLEQTTLDTPLIVWLKVDTGMSRLGFYPEDVKAIYDRLSACKNVTSIRLLTHFPEADDIQKPVTSTQIEVFNKLSKDFAGEHSLAKSAGILAYPDSHAQWIRPGIMLYGVSPLKHKTAAELDLQPVMTLKAPVVAVRKLKKGSAVGYGGTYICPEDMLMAVVGVGYGDGYPRHTKLGAPVFIHGKRVPLMGRVCMDMIMVDVRECPDVKIGDQVTLWGEGLPAEEVARYADTIAYELFCGVSKRVQFELI